MTKLSIKHRWDEALAIVNILHACHDCCEAPGYKRLAPVSKMLFAHLQVMYVRLAPKVLVHKPRVSISYNKVDAHALIAVHTNIGSTIMVNEHTAYVLRKTVEQLDQAFA
jgi:hypothetical protein